MSTKGTIFLTNGNDHVYDETNDWSIVFEISVENIECIKYRGNDKKTNETFFGIIPLDFEYIILQTRPEYNFIDSFKKYAFSEKNFYFDCNPNELNKLFFKLGELDLIETDKDVFVDKEEKIYTFWDIEITIKKETEWFDEYKKALQSYIVGNRVKIDYIEGLLK